LLSIEGSCPAYYPPSLKEVSRQVSILGTADGEHRRCLGVCGLLFEIPEEPVS